MKAQLPTQAEQGQLQKLLDKLDLDGRHQLTSRVSPGNPWIELRTTLWSWSGEAGTQPPRQREWALWRATGAVYECDDMGAVMDDPYIEAAWTFEEVKGTV